MKMAPGLSGAFSFLGLGRFAHGRSRKPKARGSVQVLSSPLMFDGFLTVLVISEPPSSAHPDLAATRLIFGSFVRVIRNAPVENQRKVFRLMATDSFRCCCADLWELAYDSGLVHLVGEATITDDLTSAFWSGQ
jgi:hypothetical protein